MALLYGDMSWETAKPQGGLVVASHPPATPSGTSESAGGRVDSPSQSSAHPAALPTIYLHGVRIHGVIERQAIEHILSALDEGRGGVVVTPNLDHLQRCGKDSTFKALVDQADLVVADGMPLIWASRVQGTPLPERVAGSDLISSLSAAAAVRGRSVFLLGGDSGTADAAAAILVQRHPQLKIAGTHFPPIGFENDALELAAIENKLRAARPDVIYVALGSPKQERLIARLRSTLPSSWWLGVGVSFSFLTGDVRRAPVWMRRCGLEWTHRLAQEPRRLFKRYVLVGVPFGARLMSRALVQRVKNRRRDAVGSVDNTQAANAPGDNGHGGEGQGATDRRDGDRRGNGHQGNGHEENGRDGNGSGVGNGHRRPGQDIGAVLSALEGGAREESRAVRMVEHRSSQPTLLLEDPTPLPSTDSIGMASLRRLRGLVLLAGSVRPNALTSAIGRNVLDLPVDAAGSMLNHWLIEADAVAMAFGLEKLPVRVLMARNSIEPRSAAARFAGAITFERDLSEYRGTGGVLANLAGDYEDDDLILVANAAQVLLDPLATATAALARTGGVVSLVSHQDGTPSGLMLVTCKALRLIPKVGFVDMKEQALPAIAARHDVRVLQTRRPTGLPVRTLADYVMALRLAHGRETGRAVATDPLAEDWRPSFAVAEAGAQVDQTARVHDAVILAGAVVEAGAVVVRSVVCAGGAVRKDRKAVDQIVSAGESDHPARRASHKGRASTNSAAVSAMAASAAVVSGVAVAAQGTAH